MTFAAALASSLIDLADHAGYYRSGDSVAAHYANTYGIFDCDTFERVCMQDYISDTYKDLNGIRPRWIDFDSMTTAEMAALCDKLSDECKWYYMEEEEREAILAANQAETNAKYMADGKAATHNPFAGLRELLAA